MKNNNRLSYSVNVHVRNEYKYRLSEVGQPHVFVTSFCFLCSPFAVVVVILYIVS